MMTVGFQSRGETDPSEFTDQARSLKFAAVCYWRASPAKERPLKFLGQPASLAGAAGLSSAWNDMDGKFNRHATAGREAVLQVAFLSGQFVNKHFSIEASAVRTPVRTTVSPLLFLTRIDAPSGFLIRRARASTSAPDRSFFRKRQHVGNSRRLAIPNDLKREDRHLIFRGSGSVSWRILWTETNLASSSGAT